MSAEVMAAIAAAQRDMPKVVKRRTGIVRSERGQSFEFKYADLSDVLEVVNPVLAKHGLLAIFSLRPEGERSKLTLSLVHAESGTSVNSEIMLPPAIGNLQFSAMMTFYRRQLLTAMLNIAAEEETPDDREAEEVAPPPIYKRAAEAAASGTKAYKLFWTTISAQERQSLQPFHAALKKQAEAADAAGK